MVMCPAPISHIADLDHDCLIDFPSSLVVKLVVLSLHLLDGLIRFLLGRILLLRCLLLIGLLSIDIDVDVPDLLIAEP